MSNKKIAIIYSAGVSLLILWTMLLPGYILSLDLVFTPYFHYSSALGELSNGAPLWHLIQGLYVFLPGWVIEKLMLFILFFLISFISYTFLPVPKKPRVQLFACLLYTANTFVYVRMLAGQWTILYAYALLPLVIHLMLASTKRATFKTEVALGAVLALIGVFSLHIFVMAVLVVFGWWGSYKIRTLARGEWKEYERFFIHGGTALLTVLVLTSYWTIPLIQTHSVIAGFTQAHWEAFAASGHGRIPVLLNLLMLGGFWGESHPWAQYFYWPQILPAFWVAFTAALALSAAGVRELWKANRKDLALFFIVLGTLALVFGSGDAATPFQSLNTFLYEHVPFWAGFRDSQKFIALLALSYAVLAGYGFDWLVTQLERNKPLPYVIALLFFIPLTFGVFVWGGFTKQLPNVTFPTAWERARTEMLTNAGSSALILPWQGYFSLSFDRNLIVANPSSQYFGAQAIVSQNIRLDGVYDQSSDAAYTALDQVIQNNATQDGQSVASFLKARGIRYVLFFQDLNGRDNFSYKFLKSPDFTLLWVENDVHFYQIN